MIDNRHEKALVFYDKELQDNPKNYRGWYTRGTAIFYLERYEEAIASYDKVLAINPDKLDAWYNKACAYSLQNQIELALENLQKAIKLDPEKYRELAKTDSDFDNIRRDSRSQDLMR